MSSSARPCILRVRNLECKFLAYCSFCFCRNFPGVTQDGISVVVNYSLREDSSRSTVRVVYEFLTCGAGTCIVHSSIDFSRGSSVYNTDVIITPSKAILGGVGNGFNGRAIRFSPSRGCCGATKCKGPPSTRCRCVRCNEGPYLCHGTNPSVIRYRGSVPCPQVYTRENFGAVTPRGAVPTFNTTMTVNARRVRLSV